MLSNKTKLHMHIRYKIDFDTAKTFSNRVQIEYWLSKSTSFEDWKLTSAAQMAKASFFSYCQRTSNLKPLNCKEVFPIDIFTLSPRLWTSKLTPLQYLTILFKLNIKRKKEHTWFALRPKPIKKLSGLMSRWRKPRECIYSTLFIYIKECERTLSIAATKKACVLNNWYPKKKGRPFLKMGILTNWSASINTVFKDNFRLQ